VQQTAGDDPERVSYHAVSRYVQRILNIDVQQDFATEKARAVALADAAGTTIDALRALIWTKGLAAAAKFGVQSFDNRAFAAVIAQPGGVVVTILLPRVRDTGKLKLLSENELKSKSWRIARRATARQLTRDSIEGVEG
jgi:hypothetical protein